MEEMVRKVNDWSGLLTFLSFIGVILFYVFGLQNGISDLKADHKANKEYQAQTIMVLTEIRDSLKDRERDHTLFSSQMATNTVAINKVSEAVIRISFALDGIEKRLNKPGP